MVSDQVRQVLYQRATRLNRHDLHSSADAKYGQVTTQGFGQYGEFPGIAVGAKTRGLRMWRLVVSVRVDVGTTSKNETVQTVEDLRMLGCSRWHDDGNRTGSFHLGEVAVGQERGGGVPHPPAGGFDITGDSDERRHAVIVAGFRISTHVISTSGRTKRPGPTPDWLGWSFEDALTGEDARLGSSPESSLTEVCPNREPCARLAHVNSPRIIGA
jgi:hypothetical protein